jgi:autophagy-related protein 16
VLTGSADRSMKVWDIHRSTYRQTTTLRHSSTAYSVDIGSDAFTAVSGHMDGGIRFWDVRTGERTADIADLHDGGITSVQFHPTIGMQVLTNGKDSCLKVIDIRTCMALYTLSHPEFRTGYSWSAAAFSPDGEYRSRHCDGKNRRISAHQMALPLLAGTYAASGSSTSGDIFVWRVLDGQFEAKLGGHKAGVGGIDWGRGGSSGQQVATVDKNGTLILWA